ncbi:nuclease-related domain-containing protein [Neobacillus bataviensis]|uniref:nuclease-related domain-containing protein n=1 Tax=Neobacillus bataviensis TaxID=220685 RepID=UPI001CBDEE92|nr:nuclease-related domain-containing protein [Neobacillus bataviensis]
MAKKNRIESKELRILKSLNTRMTLAEKDRQHYYSLKKGYEGEVMFDTLTEKLQYECTILNDLLFKVNNSTFQIDTLIIISENMHVYEVKNYEGEYFYEGERLYKKPKTEYSDPLVQLNRSESLLRQLLHREGYQFPIDGKVVFINPEFTLYQAPLDKPIILPTLVNSYLKKLDLMPSILTTRQEKLADKLISLHIEENPYTILPTYKYDEVRKGLTCALCNSFSISVTGKKCVCGDCGHEELVTVAVMRCVREYMLLFPDQKISTNVIHEWCGVVESKKRIRRILEKNFKIVGVGQWAYFEY